MMRRIAVAGDQLGPHGGQVAGYEGRPAFFHGHQPALVGGKAYCQGCKSTGTIAKSGGPRRMQFMGEIALDGDIVLCACPSPSRIVAVLAGEAWYEDMGGESGASANAGNSAASTSLVETYDELVIAMGPTGPIEGYPYFVETSDGRQLFGHTDECGQLPRISTVSAGALTVYWGDEALAKQQENSNA